MNIALLTSSGPKTQRNPQAATGRQAPGRHLAGTWQTPAGTSVTDSEARCGGCRFPPRRQCVRFPENAFSRPLGGPTGREGPRAPLLPAPIGCSSGPACQDSRHARSAQTHMPPIGSEDRSGIPPARECQLGRRARAKRSTPGAETSKRFSRIHAESSLIPGRTRQRAALYRFSGALG